MINRCIHNSLLYFLYCDCVLSLWKRNFCLWANKSCCLLLLGGRRSAYHHRCLPRQVWFRHRSRCIVHCCRSIAPLFSLLSWRPPWPWRDLSRASSSSVWPSSAFQRTTWGISNSRTCWPCYGSLCWMNRCGTRRTSHLTRRGKDNYFEAILCLDNNIVFYSVLDKQTFQSFHLIHFTHWLLLAKMIFSGAGGFSVFMDHGGFFRRSCFF